VVNRKNVERCTRELFCRITPAFGCKHSENSRTSQSLYSVSGPSFEPGTSGYKIRYLTNRLSVHVIVCGHFRVQFIAVIRLNIVCCRSALYVSTTYEYYNHVGFEVFTAVVMKSIIFLDMTPCSPLSFNRSFGGTYPRNDTLDYNHVHGMGLHSAC
jgi:hypothetical protein